MSDDFVHDLEEELVAAATFRAARRRRPRRVGRGVAPLRAAGALLVAAAVVAVVAVAVLALVRGGGDGPADDPPAPPPPPPGVTLPLPAMLPLPRCYEEPARDEPAADLLPPMAVFERPQVEPDGMPVDSLPVAGFDPRESRRPGREGLKTEFTLVPSRGIRRDGRCPERGDDGPGLCLVAGIAQPPQQLCFTATEVAAGRAVAQLGPALLIGAVPDGVTTVTLAAAGKRAIAPVVENAYEAVLPGVRPGVPVTVTLARDRNCRPGVAPALRDRIVVLDEPAQAGNPLPHAALETLNWWTWQLDAIVPDGARYWGRTDGVEFWVVPIVPKGGGECAPATHVCVVAVPNDAAADAQCVLEWPDDGEEWRIGPLLPGHAVIYGIVPDGTTGARVTIDGRTAEVAAGANVIGGVLPFAYRDGARIDVDLIDGSAARRPRVAVVDAGGPAGAVNRQLAQAGYGTVAPARSRNRAGMVVEWWADRTTWATATAVAELVGADDVVERDPTARSIVSNVAPITVIVGTR
jgi:hypothetical protein